MGPILQAYTPVADSDLGDLSRTTPELLAKLELSNKATDWLLQLVGLSEMQQEWLGNGQSCSKADPRWCTGT